MAFENNKFINNMTSDVLEVIGSFDEESLKAEFLFCNEQYKKAIKAEDISLPATAASGEPVLHGSRLIMHNIAYYWERRRDAAKEYLPSEWVEEQGVSSMKIVR